MKNSIFVKAGRKGGRKNPHKFIEGSQHAKEAGRKGGIESARRKKEQSNVRI